jgi:hypothetical protein
VYKTFDFEEVNVAFSEPGRIFNPGEARFDVELTHNNSRDTVKYAVEAKAINRMTGREYKAAPVKLETPFGQPASKQIKLLTARENGVYDLEIEVKRGNTLIDKITRTFSVMPAYQPQFLDRFGAFGVNSHMGNAYGTPEFDTERAIMLRTGFNMVRNGISWGRTEAVKGTIDTEKWANAGPLAVKGTHVEPWLAFGSNNEFYTQPPEIFSTLPTRRENIEAFLKYCEAVLSVSGDATYFELWNEPDHRNFWPDGIPDPYVLEYLTKEVSLLMDRVKPEARLISQTIGREMNATFTPALFEAGILNYVDAYSHHFYLFGQDPQNRYTEMIRNNGNVSVEGAGGWKDMYMSETGYTLVRGAMGATEEQQADYTVKEYILCDANGLKNTMYYDLRDDGTNPDDKEHNFGLTYNDYSAKAALVSVSMLTRTLQGAELVGELPLGVGLTGYLYSKAGEPVLVAWAQVDESHAADFGAPVETLDLYGNEGQSGASIEITSQPLYVFNLPKCSFSKAAGNTLSEYYSDFLAQWEAALLEPALSGFAAEIRAQKAFADGLLTQPAAEAETAERLESLYRAGKTLLEDYYAETFDLPEKSVMLMLDQLHRAGEKLAALLSTLVAPSPQNREIESAAPLAAVREKVAAKFAAAHGGSLRYTQDMIYKAADIADMCAAANESAVGYKAGFIRAYDLWAKLLLEWADVCADGEKVYEAHNVLMRTNPTHLKMFCGDDPQDVTVEIVNYKYIPFSGTLVVEDDKGNPLAAGKEITIAPGQLVSETVTAALGDAPETASVNYRATFLRDGEAFLSHDVPIEVYSVLTGKILPVEKPFAELTEVELEFSTVSAKNVEVDLTVTPPEGIRLGNGSQKLVVKPGAPLKVTLNVAGAERNAYNNYVFHVAARNEKGAVVFEQDMPLSFAATVRAEGTLDPADFDGDMTFFQDAYPIFLNPPEKPQNEADWYPSNYAARVYTKWDDEYYYLLADVYDDHHCVITKGYESYNADCIQLSFDPVNDKTAGTYGANDYEYTVSLHPSGPQIYAHNAPVGQQAGDRSSDWARIVRDDALRVTRYYLRFPKAELAPLPLTVGAEYGLNVVLNDADVTYRESYAQLTSGTGDGKNPSKYLTWRLFPAETNAAPLAGAAKHTRVTLSEGAGAPSFEDIGGHWAAAEILALANAGIAQGVDAARYDPEGAVTRAEFLALAARVVNLDPKRYAGAYADVSAEAWYASLAQAAADAGLVDEGLTPDRALRPNQPVTREEIAALAAAAYGFAAGGAPESGGAPAFRDTDEAAAWAAPYLQTAVSLGLLRGENDGGLAPKRGATRAEAAAIIYRLLEAVQGGKGT